MREDDLIIATERDGSPGGQHIGNMAGLLTVMHVPTRLKVSVRYSNGEDFRTQHKDRSCAVQIIEWGLSELKYIDVNCHPGGNDD